MSEIVVVMVVGFFLWVGGVVTGAGVLMFGLREGRKGMDEVLAMLRDVVVGDLVSDDAEGGVAANPDLVPGLRHVPPIDPTDDLIPETRSEVSLAERFPHVDPWLIGEPELPETIGEAEIHPEEPQVMTDDGSWVPLSEAVRRDETEGGL